MKSIIIIILSFAAFNVFLQSITNTLGTSGLFTVKDASTNYLSLSQATGYLSLNQSLVLQNTVNSTTGVIYKGVDRFIHNYGSSNIFIGINAGNFTMSGFQNTVLGMQSLYSNTTGFNNTAVGYQSLTSNTTGQQNTALGLNSLSSNTSGNFNTAVGRGSLFNNNTGNYNTAVGNNSLNFNTTGISNTAVGQNSLYYNTTGNYNTALGYLSLQNNTTGLNNTALGYESLISNITANNNTAVGYFSLFLNTTGTENTALGVNSLYTNITGSGNTAVGWNSLYSSTGSQNTALGHHSLQNNSTGNFNTALGYNAGSTITTGANLTCIGIDAAPTSPTALDQITLGNTFVSSLRCNVTTITSLSDMRDKKNIKDLSLGLDFITKLKPRQFNWDKREWYDDNKSDGSKMKVSPTAGFIAQELDEIQTTENAEWLNLVLKDNPEKWEATPGNLFPVVVKAIQELKTENDGLRSENSELKERLIKIEQLQNTLTSEIEKIKSKESDLKEVKLGEK